MNAGSGPPSPTPFATYSRHGWWWRTFPGSSPSTTGQRWRRFSRTWPTSGSMSYGACYQRPTWAPPTDGAASGSWATPSTRDYKDSSGQAVLGTNPDGSARKRTDQLGRQAHQWSTPTVDDANNVTRASGAFKSLSRDTHQWATPAAHESRLGFQDRTRGKKGSQESISTQAQYWTGQTPSQWREQMGPVDQFQRPRRKLGLNPRFGLWLMGYPAGWLDCVQSATRSSPPALTKSSGASSEEIV